MPRTQHLLSPRSLLTYLSALMMGLLYAQMMPTLSLFVVERFDASPFELGVFFVLLAAVSIGVSQAIAGLSDRGFSRHWLIGIGLCAGALASWLFSLCTSYMAALTVALCCFSLTAISFPQIMALCREYANEQLDAKTLPLYNALLRASFALSWVGGPPLGFWLQHRFGAELHYQGLALAFIAVAFASALTLPKVKPLASSRQAEPAPAWPRALYLGFLACSLLFAVNHSYMLAVPQLLSQHLGFSSHHAGQMMGLAALLEIPIMLAGGFLASRMPLLPLLRLGALSALLYSLGIWFATELWHLFALQFFNALFIGCIAALGMTWFQNLLPGYAGTASSLFTNAINLGNIIGSLLIGLVASWVGYRHLYLANAACALLALGLLFWARGDGGR